MNTAMPNRGFLGIDAGTQGLSVLLVDESLNVVAEAEAGYEMVPGLASGCFEQAPGDWEAALSRAARALQEKPASDRGDWEVLGIGISGQMHGEVLCDSTGAPLGTARLWCDSRNEEEGHQLTELFGVKVPKRMTAARWLWSIRHDLEKAKSVCRITTPAGWLAYRLTDQWNLGIGDASGMFPIDNVTRGYDRELLKRFDALVPEGVAALHELLPQARLAGQDAGVLTEAGAKLLGLPSGIPVAPAEGDQPAALAGSLIGDAGIVSMSFGTSVCANAVGDRTFQGVSPAIDHFCAVDGKPINMVFLRNGTTFMNSMVEMFGTAANGEPSESFANFMPQLLQAPPDCGGILALPFMEDEPGLGVSRGGTALLIGLNANNARPGNVAKAAFLSTTFNLRFGGEILAAQGYPRTEIVLSGGLAKTPALGQLVADVFRTSVTLLPSAREGTAWGAALLAKYRWSATHGELMDWTSFLKQQASFEQLRFSPNAAAADVYDQIYARYRSLLELQDRLDQAINEPP